MGGGVALQRVLKGAGQDEGAVGVGEQVEGGRRRGGPAQHGVDVRSGGASGGRTRELWQGGGVEAGGDGLRTTDGHGLPRSEAARGPGGPCLPIVNGTTDNPARKAAPAARRGRKESGKAVGRPETG
ncbi:hypothetical protein GCM10010519_63330 [Streptomyces lactacystinicus]